MGTQRFEFTRAIASWLPRGRKKLYDLSGRHESRTWKDEPQSIRCMYDPAIAAWVTLDMHDWRDRRYYFFREYDDLANEWLINSEVRTGDTYIDIGANYGIHSLHAAHAVGNPGQVIAFEPHPHTFSLLQAHLVINRIRNCTLHQIGLSDTAGELMLSNDDPHSGRFTLRQLDHPKETVTVAVHTLDDVVNAGQIVGNLHLKIDVEGYECQVLSGGEQLLTHPNLQTVSIEVIPEFLKEAGSSDRELFERLTCVGLTPYVASACTRKRGVADCRLKQLAGPSSESQYDALFIRKSK